jgi:hypothetical protein
MAYPAVNIARRMLYWLPLRFKCSFNPETCVGVSVAWSWSWRVGIKAYIGIGESRTIYTSDLVLVIVN